MHVKNCPSPTCVQVLRMLASKLNSYVAPARRNADRSGGAGTSSRVETVLRYAKEHLGRLEALRKLFAQVHQA
jgi:hypothetical protein